MKTQPAARFHLGRLAATPAALRAIAPEELFHALLRHLAEDWGALDKEDWRENDLSVEKGFRLLSSYETASGTTFWIVTEADRSATTVLLPDDY